MFERFTRDARRVVTAGEAEARALGAEAVAPEHLLLGFVVAACGGNWLTSASGGLLTAGTLREAILREEAEALEHLGISLDAVRAEVERSLGVGAWGRGSRGGHLPFSGESKRALELALRESLELRQRRLTRQHVLLGLLRHGGVRGLLDRVGVAADEVHGHLRASLLRKRELLTR